MIRALNARYHTSTISRTLKKEQNRLNAFKQHHIKRNLKFDKRERYFFIIDDTTVMKYGRNVYGSDYNYSNTVGGKIWSNCLVTFQIKGKKGR